MRLEIWKLNNFDSCKNRIFQKWILYLVTFLKTDFYSFFSNLMFLFKNWTSWKNFLTFQIPRWVNNSQFSLRAIKLISFGSIELKASLVKGNNVVSTEDNIYSVKNYAYYGKRIMNSADYIILVYILANSHATSIVIKWFHTLKTIIRHFFTHSSFLLWHTWKIL